MKLVLEEELYQLGMTASWSVRGPSCLMSGPCFGRKTVEGHSTRLDTSTYKKAKLACVGHRE